MRIGVGIGIDYPTRNSPFRGGGEEEGGLKVSYITIDQNISDPATMISGDINGSAIRLIRKKSHRVVGKYTGNKQMTYCRLSDYDGTKYFNGTPYIPQNGADVFMMLPEFYTQATEISPDVWQIGFAIGEQPDETWKKWGGNDLIGVYKSYYDYRNNKLYSRTKVYAATDFTQVKNKGYARNRGDGYTLVKHKHTNIMAFLFYAMYGNTNSQDICGMGILSNVQMGGTDLLGMKDTLSTTNLSSGFINFWGLENWWGGVSEWVDNIVVDNRVWKVTEDDGTVRTCPQSPISNGYISKIQVSEHLDVICKKLGVSSTTGYCDYYYQNYNTGLPSLRTSGNGNNASGVASISASNPPSHANSYIASRLAFMGDLVEAESVATFVQMPIINA